MNMTWFRLYHDLPDDIKLRKFTPQEKWAWISLLCLASKSGDRGTILAHDEDISDYCEFNSTQDWLYYRDKLIAKGMLEINELGTLSILHWADRQYDKPSSTPNSTKERKRRQREREKTLKSLDVTPMSRDVTPSHATDTDSDSDSDSDSETYSNTEEYKNISANAHEKTYATGETNEDLQKATFLANMPELEETEVYTPKTCDEVPEEPIKSKQIVSVRKTGTAAKPQESDWLIFVESYNRDKPPSWAKCSSLNSQRLRALKTLHKEHGENLAFAFQEALKFINQDPWWQKQSLGFTNFVRHVTDLAEKAEAIEAKDEIWARYYEDLGTALEEAGYK